MRDREVSNVSEQDITKEVNYTARIKLACEAAMFISILVFTLMLYRFSGSGWSFLALLLLLLI